MNEKDCHQTVLVSMCCIRHSIKTENIRIYFRLDLSFKHASCSPDSDVPFPRLNANSLHLFYCFRVVKLKYLQLRERQRYSFSIM